MRARKDPSRVSDEGLSPPAELTPEIEALYRQLCEKLIRHAKCRHGLRSDDARDVVQDAFVVLLGKFSSVRNPAAWLQGVVDGIAVNRIRTRARRAKALAHWGPGSWPNYFEET